MEMQAGRPMKAELDKPGTPPGAAVSPPADGVLTGILTTGAVEESDAESMAALRDVVSLLGPSTSLGMRPDNLGQHAVLPAMFAEPRPRPCRRYARARATPIDAWKPHGGTSTRRVRLPPSLQLGGAPQELIRRSGKIVRPHGLPALRFRQYEMGPCGGQLEPGTTLYVALEEPVGAAAAAAAHGERARADAPAEPAAAAGFPGTAVDVAADADDLALVESWGSAFGAGSSSSSDADEAELGDCPWSLEGCFGDDGELSESDSRGDFMRPSHGTGTDIEGEDRVPPKRSVAVVDLGMIFGGEKRKKISRGDHRWWSTVTVSALSAAMMCSQTQHASRELREVDDVLGNASAPVSLMEQATTAAEFVDGVGAAIHAREVLEPLSLFVLAMLLLALLSDAVVDLRVFPRLDRFCAVAIRQTCLRILVYARILRSMHWLGPWGWTLPFAVDSVLQLSGLLSQDSSVMLSHKDRVRTNGDSEGDPGRTGKRAEGVGMARGLLWCAAIDSALSHHSEGTLQAVVRELPVVGILLLRLGWGGLRSARPPRPEGSECGYSAGGTWRPWEKAKSI